MMRPSTGTPATTGPTAPNSHARRRHHRRNYRRRPNSHEPRPRRLPNTREIHRLHFRLNTRASHLHYHRHSHIPATHRHSHIPALHIRRTPPYLQNDRSATNHPLRHQQYHHQQHRRPRASSRHSPRRRSSNPHSLSRLLPDLPPGVYFPDHMIFRAIPAASPHILYIHSNDSAGRNGNTPNATRLPTQKRSPTHTPTPHPPNPHHTPPRARSHPPPRRHTPVNTRHIHNPAWSHRCTRTLPGRPDTAARSAPHPSAGRHSPSIARSGWRRQTTPHYPAHNMYRDPRSRSNRYSSHTSAGSPGSA